MLSSKRFFFFFLVKRIGVMTLEYIEYMYKVSDQDPFPYCMHSQCIVHSGVITVCMGLL